MLGLVELALLAHELESSLAERSVSVDYSRALDEMREALERDAEHVAVGAAPGRAGDAAEQFQSLLGEWARHAEALAAESGKLLRGEVRAEGALLRSAELETLWPALVHLLRNAVDHGLELPDERGDKSPEGRLTLSVAVTPSCLLLTVEDDGKGIDLEAIRAAALTRGLRQAHQVAAYSRPELLELLFEPGFSTRGEVSELSGRGVGLAAARRQVEALGGLITVESELRRGTRFLISMPVAER
jgi:chemotaxis protein histidine kinase CheA